MVSTLQCGTAHGNEGEAKGEGWKKGGKAARLPLSLSI